jgi:hypothetical protein
MLPIIPVLIKAVGPFIAGASAILKLGEFVSDKVKKYGKPGSKPNSNKPG